MLLPEFKLAFIHIPKNAGKSFENFLTGKPVTDPHRKDWMIINSIKRGEIQGYFSFTIIRNPFDRLVSIYHHYARGGNQSYMDLAIGQKLCKEVGFERFILDIESMRTVLPFFHEIELMLIPQNNWCCNNEGRVLLKHIGIIENLKHTVNIVQRLTGIKKALEHLNSSPRRCNYMSYFTLPMKQKVIDLYAADIELHRKAMAAINNYALSSCFEHLQCKTLPA